MNATNSQLCRRPHMGMHLFHSAGHAKKSRCLETAKVSRRYQEKIERGYTKLRDRGLTHYLCLLAAAISALVLIGIFR